MPHAKLTFVLLVVSMAVQFAWFIFIACMTDRWWRSLVVCSFYGAYLYTIATRSMYFWNHIFFGTDGTIWIIPFLIVLSWSGEWIYSKTNTFFQPCTLQLIFIHFFLDLFLSFSVSLSVTLSQSLSLSIYLSIYLSIFTFKKTFFGQILFIYLLCL